MRCPACGCSADHAAHAIVAALAADDLDGAIEAGLLEALPCRDCGPECRAAVSDARTERLRALAARDRHRVRNARLQRRAEARALARPAAEMSVQPALPPAAAAALARAKAKAAGNKPQ